MHAFGVPVGEGEVAIAQADESVQTAFVLVEDFELAGIGVDAHYAAFGLFAAIFHAVELVFFAVVQEAIGTVEAFDLEGHKAAAYQVHLKDGVDVGGSDVEGGVVFKGDIVEELGGEAGKVDAEEGVWGGEVDGHQAINVGHVQGLVDDGHAFGGVQPDLGKGCGVEPLGSCGVEAEDITIAVLAHGLQFWADI